MIILILNSNNMVQLFINAIMNHDWNRLNMLAVVLIILYSCVLSAVLIDLFFGVKVAIQKKVVRTSYGFRRTITKLTSYFGLMMLLTFADVVASIIFPMPYFTVIGAIGIIAVEIKSVYEHIRGENKHIEEIPEMLLKIYENKDSLQEMLTFINEKTNENLKQKKNGNNERVEEQQPA
jgi:hypothetical protein